MKRLPGIFFCILLILLPAFSDAGIETPVSPECTRIVMHKAYSLCYDEDHEQARWAAYRLSAAMLGRKVGRSDDFRPDPLVVTGSATPEDYRKSGYDKGHLVPAGDMNYSAECMSETFYMSNMSPQVPAFNRGIWKKLEEKVRVWAKRDGEVCVVTGPVLVDQGLATIGHNRVAVPLRFYKVILDYREPELKAIAFIIPNAGSKANLATFAVTVDQAEEITAIDFFPEVPDAVEEELESSIDLAKWFPEGAGGKAAVSKPGKVASREAALTHWLNTDSNVRHNKSCRYYGKSAEGRLCGPREGTPCSLCGG